MDQPASLLQRLSEARYASVVAEPPSGAPVVMAVCNQKGGCGKTTTAINLAAGLGLRGYPTLLIDLDPQGNAGLGLGLDVERLTHTIYDLFHDPQRRLEDVIVPTKVPNLSLAPANALLSGAQLELATVLNREQVLRRVVRRLGPRFRYLIIDCSPSLNLLTINALAAADFCLVPLQPHYYALEGTRELFATIELIQERFNPALRLLGILPVLSESRTAVTRELLEQIRAYFREKVFETTIRFSAKLIEASIAGQPVLSYAPRSAGAQDYARLAEEVLARMREAVLAKPGGNGASTAG